MFSHTEVVPLELSSVLSLQAQNAFTGTIPDMGNLTELVLLDVAGNQLQGGLPLDWAASEYLAYFSAQNNLLTGAIPVAQIGGRPLSKQGRTKLLSTSQNMCCIYSCSDLPAR